MRLCTVKEYLRTAGSPVYTANELNRITNETEDAMNSVLHTGPIWDRTVTVHYCTFPIVYCTL